MDFLLDSWAVWVAIGAPLYVLISMARFLIEGYRKVSPPIYCRVSRIQSRFYDWRMRRIVLKRFRTPRWSPGESRSSPRGYFWANDFGYQSKHWFTDERFVRALRALRERRAVYSVPVFDSNFYPLKPVATRYRILPRGHSFEQAEYYAKVEASCAQWNSPCDYPDRYLLNPSYFVTTESGVTHYGGGKYLAPGASPCARCFDREPESDRLIDRLINYDKYVNRLLMYDFASHESVYLADAIIKACKATACDDKLPFVKLVVEEALKLSHGRDEFELQAELEAYIRTRQEATE